MRPSRVLELEVLDGVVSSVIARRADGRQRASRSRPAGPLSRAARSSDSRISPTRHRAGAALAEHSLRGVRVRRTLHAAAAASSALSERRAEGTASASEDVSGSDSVPPDQIGWLRPAYPAARGRRGEPLRYPLTLSRRPAGYVRLCRRTYTAIVVVDGSNSYDTDADRLAESMARGLADRAACPRARGEVRLRRPANYGQELSLRAARRTNVFVR